MNCRQAEPQIFAERDGALDNSQRAALAQHIAECAACRRLREDFTVTIEAWRVTVQQVRVPDAELEWQRLRREIRGGAGSKSAATMRNRVTWFALPLAAAAALAIVYFVRPSGDNSATPAGNGQAVARATGGKPAADNPSTIVFVDDK